MTFQDFAVLLSALSTIFAGVGLFCNISQSRRTNAQARATLVAEFLREFASDEEIRNAFYSIEYSEFQYTANFHKSQQEREIDKLLRHFANLALAWQAGLLSIKDLYPVRYYILRVMRYPEIEKYLEFIARWSRQASIGEHPFMVLAKLSKALEK